MDEEGEKNEEAFDSKSGGNFYNDFGEIPSTDNKVQRRSISAASDPSLFQSLQRRQRQIQQSSRQLLERWRAGSVRSFPAFTLNEQHYGGPDDGKLPFDWVRRIDVGAYPRVACGSAHGSVYVADVEARRVLGVARAAHSSRHLDGSVDALDERLRRQIYGEYDGGGVLAVAMHGTGLVASAGREGGAKLFRLTPEGELRHAGDVPSLTRPLPGATPVLVTCLRFDSAGRLFVGGQDGFLRMVACVGDSVSTDDPGKKADQMQVAVVSSPRDQMQRSPVLSLVVSEELNMVATAHANGNVCIHSLDQDDERKRILGIWNPFTSASTARSVAFVSGGEGEENANPRWSIVVGGGNGELWMREIHPSRIPTTNVDDHGDYDRPDKVSTVPLFAENSTQQIKPSHAGPVLSLAARPNGVLVSAGQGGVLCVSQLWPTPTALYGLGGYKVWIGDVRIDAEGKRLLSDGRDDIVVVHDFSLNE